LKYDENGSFKRQHAPVFSDEGIVIEVKKTHKITTIYIQE